MQDSNIQVPPLGRGAGARPRILRECSLGGNRSSPWHPHYHGGAGTSSHGICDRDTIRESADVSQALFADGSGSPKLEKMLLTCAVQLAEFCGLHLRPQTSDAPFAEEQNRRWVFWALYVYDKHLALRSGRPSVCTNRMLLPTMADQQCTQRIDDDDISCELPTWAPDGNNDFLECFRLYIDQAKLTSVISKAFLTLKARRLPLIEKANLVRQVDRRLRDWYNNMPDKFKTMALAEPHTLPPGIRTEHILYLHFSYHGNLAATHSIFGHPWNVDITSDTEDRIVKDQIKMSDEALADSARNIILATRWVAIDAAAHVW